jgi:hypothetical protein
MDVLPPNTRPIPLQGNAYTFTENVRETAILAVSFAEDFERLLELYNIVDYDIYVRSKMFTLNHSSRFSEQKEETQQHPKEETPEEEIKFSFNIEAL